MAERVLAKVTAFVTREGMSGLELLLFRHPNAGVQIPAGTVEEGETLERAALREVREETGLVDLRVRHYIGHLDERLSDDRYVVLRRTSVYARPDVTSFDWAEFRRGIQVRRLRRQGSFVQVTYEEWDQFPDPTYLTYQITGWVPQDTLGRTTRRHFFRLTAEGEIPDAWTTFADHHLFQPFWAPLASLPEIVTSQCRWLTFVRDELRYSFGCTGSPRIKAA